MASYRLGKNPAYTCLLKLQEQFFRSIDRKKPGLLFLTLLRGHETYENSQALYRRRL